MSVFSLETIRRRLLHGLIPAVPVPFNARAEISLEAQERYAGFMARERVAGVAVWAHTGRGLRLTRTQRLEVLQTWTRALGADEVVVAGVGGSPEAATDFPCYAASAVEMARDAIAHGAHALLVHPPRIFHRAKGGDELIMATAFSLASVYAIGALRGRRDALHRRALALGLAAGAVIAPVQIVVGDWAARFVAQRQPIKLATLDSVMTFQDVAGLVRREFPGKLVITGEDRFFGYSLMCGAEAALVGMGATCATLQKKMIESFFRGRSAEFLELSRQVDRLSQSLFRAPMEGYIRRILWALAHQGVIERESANDPWGPELAESEFAELGKIVKELGTRSAA